MVFIVIFSSTFLFLSILPYQLRLPSTNSIPSSDNSIKMVTLYTSTKGVTLNDNSVKSLNMIYFSG